MRFRIFYFPNTNGYEDLLVGGGQRQEWLVAEWQSRLGKWYPLNWTWTFEKAYQRLEEYEKIWGARV